MNANDLERELRTVLDERAAESRVRTNAAPSVVRRARGRQIGTLIGAAFTALAIVAAFVLAAGVIERSPSRPAIQTNEPAAVKTAQLPDVTITYPGNWYLLIFQAVDGVGDLVQLTNFDPASTKPCFSGDSVDLPSDGVVLLLNRGNGTIGPGADRWPVDLRYDPSPSACRPGGSIEAQPGIPLHYSTSWTSRDAATPYEVNAMVGPDVDARARTALFDAFASLSVRGTGDFYNGPPAYVLDSGIDRGRPWVLEAIAHGEGARIALAFPGHPDLTKRLSATHVDAVELESGLRTTWSRDGTVIWGLAGRGVARIASSGGARTETTPLPPSFGSPYSAFAIPVPDPFQAALATFDADGNETGGLDTGSGVAPPPAATLSSGTAAGHQWSLETTADRGLFLRVDGEAIPGVEVLGDGTAARSLSAMSHVLFDAGAGQYAVVVYGATDDRTRWVGAAPSDGGDVVLARTRSVWPGVRVYAFVTDIARSEVLGFPSTGCAYDIVVSFGSHVGSGWTPSPDSRPAEGARTCRVSGPAT
jgi:hypothetical protein